MDGIGWTVHRTQAAARTSQWIPLQETAQTGRVELTHKRVVLGCRPAEQGPGYI